LRRVTGLHFKLLRLERDFGVLGIRASPESGREGNVGRQLRIGSILGPGRDDMDRGSRFTVDGEASADGDFMGVSADRRSVLPTF